jgi:hypothetical protein
MQASISRREAEAKPELGFAEERLIAVGMNSTIDMALEVVTLPVSDVDRAKDFYASLGWRFDSWVLQEITTRLPGRTWED